MKIRYGLKDGALLQRDAQDVCKCYFKADAVGNVTSSLGTVTACEDGTLVLSGIPVGGPYCVTLRDDVSAITLSDLYVGDLWLLAGQSNMEGAGKWREKYQKYDADPSPTVRAYYMNESWGAAKSQLHQLWESLDPQISLTFRNDRKNSRWGAEYPEIQNNGVGPGLFFSLEMQNRMGGVPQGVIPCGIGGSSLWQWNPEGENNLYSAAVRRFRECGGNIKGIFWHQGESQTMECQHPTFHFEMERLISGMRRDFGANIPIVQVQLNKYVAASPAIDDSWNKVREMQRTLDKKIENLATVYSLDLETDDLIHLSSESHEILGARAAEAMCVLLGEGGAPSPELESFEIIQDDYMPFFANLRVSFKNIAGELCAKGTPAGFYILDSESGTPLRAISRICLEGSSARVKVEFDFDKLRECYVGYGYGNDFYCNITDSDNRSIPGFGPLKINDYLKKESN